MTVPIILLVWVFRSIDAEAALASLGNADVALVLAGVLLVQLQILQSAERWRFTAGRLGQSLSRSRAVREYYVAFFINQVLPGGIAGDAVRALRNRTVEDGSAPRGAGLRAIILERLAGQTAFFIVAAAGLAAWPLLIAEQMPKEAGTHLLAGLVLAAALLAAVAALAFFGPRRWRDFLMRLGPDIRRAYFERWAWLVQGMMSTLLVGSYIAVFAICAAAIGAPVPIAAWITVIPLCLFTMLIPLSTGGWGLRETAAAALWPLIGLSSADGVAAAILYGLVSLAGSLPALVFLRTPETQRA